MDVKPFGQACGAAVRGIDLSRLLLPADVAAIRAAWLEHHVLAFPDQAMTDDDLERFTLAFGGFGVDPFIAPIPGREHVIAVERRADETVPLFCRELAQRLELPGKAARGRVPVWHHHPAGRG